MFTRIFWKRSTERALKTAAQAVALGIGTAAGFDAVNADWEYLLSMGLGGVVLSYLSSIISSPIGDDETTPSLVD